MDALTSGGCEILNQDDDDDTAGFNNMPAIRGSEEISPDCKIVIWGPDATSNISTTPGSSDMQF
jgi:hypothetical protein